LLEPRVRGFTDLNVARTPTRRAGPKPRYHWSVAVLLPRGPMRAEDLAGLPDDGHRYELIEGTLLVTPAPGIAHQRAVARLHILLATSMASEFEAVLAPFDYQVSSGTVLEPDLLVARVDQLQTDRLTSAPVLVVEVLSPSTRAVDLGAKRLAYQDARVPSYWVIDPAARALTVHRLDAGGRYDVTVVTPPDVWTDPELRVTVDPAAICRPPR
jgi:Uma2 family endonuclease